MLNRWNDMSELCITMYNYCFAGESKKLNICHLRCNQSVGLFSLHGGSFACFLSMSPNESPLECARLDRSPSAQWKCQSSKKKWLKCKKSKQLPDNQMVTLLHSLEHHHGSGWHHLAKPCSVYFLDHFWECCICFAITSGAFFLVLLYHRMKLGI